MIVPRVLESGFLLPTGQNGPWQVGNVVASPSKDAFTFSCSLFLEGKLVAHAVRDSPLGPVTLEPNGSLAPAQLEWGLHRHAVSAANHADHPDAADHFIVDLVHEYLEARDFEAKKELGLLVHVPEDGPQTHRFIEGDMETEEARIRAEFPDAIVLNYFL